MGISNSKRSNSRPLIMRRFRGLGKKGKEIASSAEAYPGLTKPVSGLPPPDQSQDAAKDHVQANGDGMCQPLGSYFHTHDSFKSSLPGDSQAKGQPKSRLGPKLNAKMPSGVPVTAKEVPRTPFEDQEGVEISPISCSPAVASRQSAREAENLHLAASLSCKNLKGVGSTSAPANQFSSTCKKSKLL